MTARVIASVAVIAGVLAVSAALGETINAAPDTLAEILSAVNPGDTVVLADGVYKGGFELRRSGADGAAITIKAVGESCVFEGGYNCLNIEGASWINVEGIRFQRAEHVGLRISAPADNPAGHVTVRGCVFAENIWPGIMTGHINHLTIEDCEAFGSVKSHGIYPGNSGDDLIVRNNRVHHNFGNGIHINGDPECGGDGVISRALVEGNVIWENGKRGGASISMTHVQDSLVRNNLVYNNYHAGIVLYYDTGGDKCASKRNTVVNNTVYCRPGEGKFGLLMRKSATDCRVMNNIIVGGRFGAVYVEPSCFDGLVMDNNVIATHPGHLLFGDSTEAVSISAADWRKNGFDANSSIGVLPDFIDTEGGNLRLLDGSRGIDAGAALPDIVPVDIAGAPRPKGDRFDCGCYEGAPGRTNTANPESLASILESVNPGDTVLLADGTYKGDLLLRRSGKEGAPITIRAAGEKAVIDGGENCLRLEGANWVTVKGIRFQNAKVAGMYVRMGELPAAEHIAVRNCVFANNQKWGIITSHINHFTVEGCETFGATIEHGIYHANSGDDAIIRNNIVHHNAGNGIHINGDPDCGGDGVMSRALVEGNVIYENGKKGGSAMSIMHVQDSVFRNNLLYNNYAHGFTLFWYTGDEATQSSKRNQVYNNTVYFRPGEGRFSLLMRKSATDCTVKNNVFFAGARGAMFVEPSCYEGLTIDNNVVANHPGQRLWGDAAEDSEEMAEAIRAAGLEVDFTDGIEVSVKSWLAKGFDAHTVFGAAPAFADVASADFRLGGGSVGIDAGAELPYFVPLDIEGTHRPQGAAFDCGCYEMPAQAGGGAAE